MIFMIVTAENRAPVNTGHEDLTMISANTEVLLEAAEVLSLQADNIDRWSLEIETFARAKRAKKRVLIIFRRSEADIKRLERQRKSVVNQLRVQSLFLCECAKRLKSAQSVTLSRQRRLR